MTFDEDIWNQIVTSFLDSPAGIMFILGVVLNFVLVVVFFVTAYNVGKIRSDLNEWLELEHPTIEKEPKIKH